MPGRTRTQIEKTWAAIGSAFFKRLVNQSKVIGLTKKELGESLGYGEKAGAQAINKIEIGEISLTPEHVKIAARKFAPAEKYNDKESGYKIESQLSTFMGLQMPSFMDEDILDERRTDLEKSLELLANLANLLHKYLSKKHAKEIWGEALDKAAWGVLYKDLKHFLGLWESIYSIEMKIRNVKIQPGGPLPEEIKEEWSALEKQILKDSTTAQLGWTYTGFARLKSRSGETTEAIKYAEFAIIKIEDLEKFWQNYKEEFPNEFIRLLHRSYIVLGDSHRALGEYSKAFQNYEKAEERIHPGKHANSRMYALNLKRFNAFVHAGVEPPERLKEIINFMISSPSSDIDIVLKARARYAKAYLEQRNCGLKCLKEAENLYKKSILDLEKEIKNNPDNGKAKHRFAVGNQYLGEVYLRRGQFENGLKALSTAITSFLPSQNRARLANTFLHDGRIRAYKTLKFLIRGQDFKRQIESHLIKPLETFQQLNQDFDSSEMPERSFQRIQFKSEQAKWKAIQAATSYALDLKYGRLTEKGKKLYGRTLAEVTKEIHNFLPERKDLIQGSKFDVNQLLVGFLFTIVSKNMLSDKKANNFISLLESIKTGLNNILNENRDPDNFIDTYFTQNDHHAIRNVFQGNLARIHSILCAIDYLLTERYPDESIKKAISHAFKYDALAIMDCQWILSFVVKFDKKLTAEMFNNNLTPAQTTELKRFWSEKTD